MAGTEPRPRVVVGSMAVVDSNPVVAEGRREEVAVVRTPMAEVVAGAPRPPHEL